LWALDAERGEVRWTFTAGRPIVAAPAVAGGIVYLVAGSRLYALAADNGLYLWSASAEDVIDASPLVLGDLLLFGAEDGWFYALDARRGTLRWRLPTGISTGSAAAEGDRVCFGTTEGAFYALDAATGHPRWQVDLEEAAASPVVRQGAVYVGLEGGQVIALSLDNGAPLWRVSLPGDVVVPPAVDDESVYIATSIGAVAALDRQSGATRWQVYLKSEANAPLVMGDNLILADTSGIVHFLNKATGEETASLTGLAPLGAPPAYGAGDRLFLVDRYRHAYAFALGQQVPERSLRFSSLWDRYVVTFGREGSVGSGPVAGGNQLLLLLDNGALWSFNPRSGEGAQVAKLGGFAPYAPAVLGGVAYIALVGTEGRGTVVAFDLAGQQILWRASLDGTLAGPLAAAEGRVFASLNMLQGGTLLALDADKGTMLWEERSLPRPGTPVVAGGQVYLAGGPVSAWDAATGELRWQSLDIGAGGVPAVCGEILYTNAWHQNEPALAALSRASGEVLWWGQDSVAFPTGRPACEPRGELVFVGGFDGRIHAYDASTGQVRWTHRTGEPFSSDLVVADGLVYGLTIESTLVALEADSGRLLARYTPPFARSSRGAPVLLENRIYLADTLSLYALEAVRE